MKVTRRQLAATLASGAAALAQPQAATPSPDAELEAARQRIAENARVLARREISMATEPAFQFKA